MIVDSNDDSSSGSDSDVTEWSPPGSLRSHHEKSPPPPGMESPISANSNIQKSADNWVELQDSALVHDEKAALLEEFERKRRARQMHVPTED